MNSSEKLKHYNNYIKSLSRKLVPFACPRCGLTVLPKHFEKHCAESHDFDAKSACVWCWGELSWIPRKKKENSVHLLSCFRKFITPHEISAALKTAKRTSNYNIVSAAAAAAADTAASIPKVLSLDKLYCPGRCFFDHDSSYIEEYLPQEALQNTFSILPVDPLPPHPYSNENVNLAASYVLKFLETQNAATHDWFHIMIKAVAFESFLNALKKEKDGAECRLLPFSCWCDGGRYEEPRHRQHRHMIAVYPKKKKEEEEPFESSEIWKSVDTEDRPCSNYLSKGLKRIKEPMHLVNTLGYLSKRTSRCEFSFKKDKKRPLKENHFYIFKTLPVKYRLPLVVLWDEGMAKLMYQELFQNISIERLIRNPLSRTNAQWRQKIGDFYDLPRGVVLPIDRNYVPVVATTTTTTTTTTKPLYLLNGRELRFEKSPETLEEDDDEWLAKQVEGGNCFYENVEGEWWIPRPSDQAVLNLVMPREYQIKELEMENACLKRKNEEILEENRQQNNKIHELNNNIHELHNKVHELNEGEIKRLKAEIVALKTELAKYTTNIVIPE